MGGEYLPDQEDGEVEIARIEIDSTTADVTSVYASLTDTEIHYRVVDEYGGDTLPGPSEMGSSLPLTLGELEAFFTGAWSSCEGGGRSASPVGGAASDGRQAHLAEPR